MLINFEVPEYKHRDFKRACSKLGTTMRAQLSQKVEEVISKYKFELTKEHIAEEAKAKAIEMLKSS